MIFSRRHFMASAGVAGVAGLAGCTGRFGTSTSYLTPILRPQYHNVVTHWCDIILQQIRDQRVPPPRAAYNLAMPTVAGFLAANSILQTYEDPFDIGTAPLGADPAMAYGVAFATAASEVFQQPFVGERMDFANGIPESEAKSLGAAWGRQVGLKIVKMRTRDGSQPSKVNYYLNRYQRRHDALQWTPTGPLYSAKPGPAFDSFSRPLFPGHGQIKPWTMGSVENFRAAPFHDPDSPEFAGEFDQVRILGGADSRERTADQSEIALFWEDGPWGITPPGHFMLIAIQVLQNRNLSFIEWARAMALMGMTQCDASIHAWDSKYHHDVIRPETAIRHRTPKFGNRDPRVQRDRQWRSYIPTPEFPAYTSGHSTFGNAGAAMIANILGTDTVRISHQSPDQVLWPQLRDVTRHWTSLSGMAEENGWSRIYGGVHWLKDHQAAMEAGKAIANHAHAQYFRVKV
ncbi:vanadium-dependent haloperoxidase [Parasphingorhabdus sp.]|uniref:vanadium-dependent haloperoxidase n=1 Tax=Parasphingorhabdus sp. TaxID=2709688 RepID=UPI003264C326